MVFRRDKITKILVNCNEYTYSFFSCGLSFPAKIVLCQLYDGRSLTRKCVKTATTANRKNRRKTHNHNQYKSRHAGTKKPVSNMPALTPRHAKQQNKRKAKPATAPPAIKRRPHLPTV